MKQDITDKIGKALDGILKSKAAIKQKKEQIEAKNRGRIVIDRSKPINVSDLDQIEEVDKEIRKLGKEGNDLIKTLIKSKEDLYNAVATYEGCDLNVYYGNEFRTIRVRKLAEDEEEENHYFEIFYNGEEL